MGRRSKLQATRYKTAGAKLTAVGLSAHGDLLDGQVRIEKIVLV
jgi:hypothetical protein